MSDYGSDYDCAYDSEELDDEGNDLIDDDGDTAVEVKLDSPTEEDYPITVLSTEQIMSFMLDTIKEVNTVVQLPPTITRILLNHFKWDKEKLYERYYEGDNQEQLFRDAHIVNPNKSKKSKKRRATRSTGNTIDCLICYLDYPAKNMISIACGHQFCKECWIQYLTTKIMEEGQGATISCASHDCDILVDDETVFDLITDSKVILRYKQLITNSFIECNRLFRWCPKPECSHVIRVEYLAFKSVKCVCNTVFCFVCGQNWHYPLKCDILKKWQKKCSDDSETFNWIAANTKDCPQCKMPIEKNGGCNHMWCRNPSCKFEFCWLCMGEWGRHGYNPCNRFNEDAVSAAKDASDRARAVLQRYLFYCNRYMNHMQSLKFENKLYEMAKTKMEEMQRHNMTWVEVQFLNTAVDVLTSCRQSLMYTYAFAYYLVKNNQVHIFEDNQKDLEAATEKLSEYLERDLTTDNLTAIKQNVQDKYRYCEARRKALMMHVKEGYDNETWQVQNDLN